MKAVAYTEILILGRVVLGALILRNSLLTPLIYAHFLRMRYYQSAFTREAVSGIQKRIDTRVAQPGTPPVAVQVWGTTKMVIGRWAGATLQPAAPAGGR
jgi:transmembrane protein 33